MPLIVNRRMSPFWVNVGVNDEAPQLHVSLYGGEFSSSFGSLPSSITERIQVPETVMRSLKKSLVDLRCFYLFQLRLPDIGESAREWVEITVEKVVEKYRKKREKLVELTIKGTGDGEKEASIRRSVLKEAESEIKLLGKGAIAKKGPLRKNQEQPVRPSRREEVAREDIEWIIEAAREAIASGINLSYDMFCRD